MPIGKWEKDVWGTISRSCFFCKINTALKKTGFGFLDDSKSGAECQNTEATAPEQSGNPPSTIAFL